MNQPISLCFGPAKNYSSSITSQDAKHILILEVINSVLAVPTAAANALVIVGILTTSSLRTPSYLLLTSLAFSDLAVGVLGQPVFTFCIFSFRNGNAKAYCYARWILNVFLSVVSSGTFLKLAAISVDRYLVIRLKMRYRSVVTVRKVRCILISVWLHGIVAVSCAFLSSVITSSIVAACEVMIVLLIIVFFYTMSFRALKIHCAQTQPQGTQQPNSTTQSNAIDVLKYRKLLKTMVLMVVVILVCYLPLLGVFIVFTDPKPNRVIAWYLLGIAALNSLFNPVIYMTRMIDLRQVCIQMFRKVFRWSIEKGKT